jgi:ADP-ribose pyrophosphatase YjhB (NUDIX family)
VYGDRIGKTAALGVGCNAVIFDLKRQRVLLARRADNGWWCLPGGFMEAGETAAFIR